MTDARDGWCSAISRLSADRVELTSSSGPIAGSASLCSSASSSCCQPEQHCAKLDAKESAFPLNSLVLSVRQRQVALWRPAAWDATSCTTAHKLADLDADCTSKSILDSAFATCVGQHGFNASLHARACLTLRACSPPRPLQRSWCQLEAALA